MDYTTLGKTNLRVSVMGLGCGGHSRLGLANGKDEAHAANIVRRAIDLGVNFIDTAESYGTEPAVARGIEGLDRGKIVLSTKVSPRIKAGLRSAGEFREAVDQRLRSLRTDYIDVLHVHAARLDDYEYVRNTFWPILHEYREAGKIRHIGLTEGFVGDTAHRMFERALQDDGWEVIMVGFNILNQSARERVFPVTQRKGIGVLDMFAVRRALSRPEALRELMADLEGKNALGFPVDPVAPLDFLLTEGPAASIPDACYRFCRDEPGINVVLVGTGNPEHLEENARSLRAPALSAGAVEKVKKLFAGIDFLSGN